MNSKWKKASIASTCFAMTASVLIFSGCDRYASTETVLSARSDGLVVVQHDGKTHTSYKVAADTAVQLDGRSATVDDLETGDSVHVTSTDRDGANVATKIVATSKESLKIDNADEPPTLPADLSTPEALDSSLHGLPDLPVIKTPETGQPEDEAQPELRSDAQEQTIAGRISRLDEEAFKVALEDGKEELVTVNADTK